jgi:iron(III) transport system ATP-binding protein
MGMVFQNYAVWPHMSVFDNVAFGLKLAKLGRAAIRERVARVLSALGLDGLEARNPAQLSGGQQQRVALARSLVVEPSILLLDEPLSNLDAKLRERMRSELKSLQRRTGITFVYVTHDQAEAMALSDRIAVFDQGTLQQYGRPREVYERPANLFVADFMGIVNRLPGEIVERADGQVRVRVGDHVLAAIGPADGVGLSRQVTLAIRPESVRLGAATTDGPDNHLDGSVVEAIFLGNIVDYHIDVGGLVLRVQADRHVVQEVGSKVRLSIPVEECVAMVAPP